MPDLRSCLSRRSWAFDFILFRAPGRFCPLAQFLSLFPPRKMNRDHWFPARFSSLSQTRRPSTASAYTTFLRARHNFFSNYQTQLLPPHVLQTLCRCKTANLFAIKQIETLFEKHQWGEPAQLAAVLCTAGLRFLSPLCFHGLTNCFSRKPFGFRIICVAPRGCGVHSD